MGPVPKALKRFIWDLSSLIDMAEGDEREIVTVGKDLALRLMAETDWLPADLAAADPAGPRHYQIYEDPGERFYIYSEVWAPGQMGEVINHGIWSFLGVLSGAEIRQRFDADGIAIGLPKQWDAGSVECLTKRSGLMTQSGTPEGTDVVIGIRIFGGPHPYQATRSNPTDRPGWDIFTIGEVREEQVS